MAIYRRGDTYWYEFVFNGERIRASAQTPNKEVARQIEAAHRVRLAKRDAGIVERSPAPTFREFAPRFTAAIETRCANKPQTIKFYKAKLGNLLRYENDRIGAPECDRRGHDTGAHRAPEVAAVPPGKPLAIGSVNRELATLRRALRLAQVWKEIDRVPKIELLSGEQEREFVLSHADEQLYLEAASPLLHDMGIVMLDTGLRVGENISLQWPDVRFAPAAGAPLGYLKVRACHSKNSKSRNPPLTERTVTVLQSRVPTKTGYVFHRGDGRPIYQTWLNQQHRELRSRLKMSEEFVPHSFRHTYGTRLGESGTDVFTIKKLMGHSSVTVSEKYVHPSAEAMVAAVARLERFNRQKGTGTASEPKVSPQKSPQGTGGKAVKPS
jgi:integrase